MYRAPVVGRGKEVDFSEVFRRWMLSFRFLSEETLAEVTTLLLCDKQVDPPTILPSDLMSSHIPRVHLSLREGELYFDVSFCRHTLLCPKVGDRRCQVLGRSELDTGIDHLCALDEHGIRLMTWAAAWIASPHSVGSVTAADIIVRTTDISLPIALSATPF